MFAESVAVNSIAISEEVSRSAVPRKRLANLLSCAWRIAKSPRIWRFVRVDMIAAMRDCLILFVHLLVTVARLAGPSRLRSVVAESMLVRHQLLILNRGRQRPPNLRATDRIIAGLCTVFIRPARVFRFAIVLKPSTLLHFHSALTKRKYRVLFSPKRRCRPGPKGPDKDLIDAVVAMKRRNPSWGCPRIAQQISLAFGVEIDKDVVR